jgi:glycosyltransferase involved in cell wall biosynthesis
MRVLHVIPSVSNVHGGPTNALNMMERSLSAIGIAVDTLATDDDGPGRRLGHDARPDTINGAHRHYARKCSEFYKLSPGLLVWLLRHGREFNVIHIHALFSFSSIAAAFAARLMRVPYIVRPLGTLSTYGIQQRRPLLKSASFRMLESGILAHAAAVHFTSQSEWDEAKTLDMPMRGVVIPLGVDAAQFSPPGSPPFAIAPGQQVVLFLSRLDPKKNVEGLIRAFATVRRSHASAVLVIAGSGPADYVASLKLLAKVEGIADATVWTGHLEGQQKWSTFASATVFVLPSFSENFGIAAVEAMIAGRALVVGRGVAIAQEIADAGAGLATEPDPPAIAHAIGYLLADEQLCRTMGEQARNLAACKFSSRAMAERLADLYADVSAVPRSRIQPEKAG